MNLLVTGAWRDAGKYIPELTAMGHQVKFLQQERDSLPCPFDWVQGVICNGLFLHHPIGRFENLRYIQLTAAGFDRVPAEYIKAHGITLFNARDSYSIPMAEHAVCGVLQLYREMRRFAENQKNHRWEKLRELRELSGKCVCIAGCGNVGRECAKRFRAFGCRVLGFARTGREEPGFDRIYTLGRLDEFLPQADVLILALALTEETRGIMDGARFGKMKEGAVFVNIARGGLADAAALEDALRGSLGGAVLDVFEEEPLDSGSPLWDMENVILTPHCSFVGDGAAERLHEVIIGNLKRL